MPSILVSIRHLKSEPKATLKLELWKKLNSLANNKFESAKVTNKSYVENV